MKNKSPLLIMRKLAQILIAFIVIAGALFPTFEAFAQTSTNTTPSGIPLDNLEKEINDFMEDRAGITVPSANVAIVKDGEIIFTGAYGFADIEKRIKATDETIYEYASVSKLFVWISAMQLAERGQLDLDADISHIFARSI